MRLLLIRHGETDRNAGRIALGREDVPLNERGRAQAQALAAGLAASGPDEPIAAVYSSPLQRALATAQPLARALDLEVQTEDGLIEMDVGEAEGRALSELQERFPDFLRAWRSDQVADVPMPGGESLRQVQERAWGAVESLRERHDNETVAVVSHNFVILTLLCRALDLPLARFRRLKHDLAAVSILEIAKERQAVLSLNDRCHLRES
ncbi:MAG: histidine phosphatase family protein [Chloroflexi bacterium]|nr:histidine phosphatase family protein [Chloroflexota bacterium]